MLKLIRLGPTLEEKKYSISISNNYFNHSNFLANSINKNGCQSLNTIKPQMFTLLQVDDPQRFGLGVLGVSPSQTPHNGLRPCKSGVLFSNGRVPSTSMYPSRASFNDFFIPSLLEIIFLRSNISRISSCQ